jgi:alkylhydroperoxidase family enzyme
VASSDPFSRRTATPGRVLPWLVELVRTLPGLADSYAPGRGINARTRERISVVVTEVNGCRYCAWIHGSWQDFLGEGPLPPEERVLAYARACAEAGHPLDPSGLEDAVGRDAVAAVRATVAQVELSNLVGNTVDGLLARLTGDRPWRPLDAALEAAAIWTALPAAAPLLATAGIMRLLGRIAPPVPRVDLQDPAEANLLALLISQAAPAFLANAALRTALLGLPATISVAIQAGRTAATVRIGRGKVGVVNGVAADAMVVIEGEVEALLKLATGAFPSDLSGIRLRGP